MNVISKFTPLNQRPPEEQPRERMMQNGVACLSTAELLCVLLRCGTTSRSALEVSQEILNTVAYNNAELSKLNIQQLKRIPGIGPAKACSIIAALELGRRQVMSSLATKEKSRVFHHSRDAARFMKQLIGHKQQEEFHVLYLAKTNRLIEHRHISTGGINNTLADPYVIYSYALHNRAMRVMLCHNHPSGHLSPSQADLRTTRRLTEAGKLLNIEVLDHIIVSHQGYFSLAEEGLM